MLSTKSKVLTLLEGNRLQVLSGSDIAKSLSLSRSAVWKSIEELRKEGHIIQAVTNRGYCLSPESDILSLEGLLYHSHNFLIKPDKVHMYNTIESTNQEAKKMAAAGADHGTVVISNQQTEGRGRRGRSFHSPGDTGLYMSLILRPESIPLDAMLITAAAAVAVTNAISQLLNKEAGIKWVNDIFIEGKKICGILTEAISDLQTASIESLILGIGINVKAPISDFPDDIKDIAGFLIEDQTFITRNQLVSAILDEVFHIIHTRDKSTIVEKYRSRSFVLGKQVTVHGVNESYEAKAIAIDDQCGLIVERSDGTKEVLNSGEVSIKPLTIINP
jgi:BirA family biotin operon repressor/biotin-[acetyl-CoA-carboxylase] ligase